MCLLCSPLKCPTPKTELGVAVITANKGCVWNEVMTTKVFAACHLLPFSPSHTSGDNQIQVEDILSVAGVLGICSLRLSLWKCVNAVFLSVYILHVTVNMIF